MDLISEPETGAADLGYRALVVDDEAALADVVASYLHRDRFEVTVCHTGAEALAAAREVDPDVVVLDLGLPGIDGLEVCRQLRTFSDAYVVMLTARDTEVDTIVGLSVGADDYVTKPFSPRELVARIRAMLRRPRVVAAAVPRAAEDPPRVFGPLSIEIASRQVFLDGELIPLTRTEFDLLAALSSRPGVVWSRRQLIDAVWGEPWVGNDHLVDVHVGHLRRKLADDPADPRFVFTVRGVGYRMGSGDTTGEQHQGLGEQQSPSHPETRRLQRCAHSPKALTEAHGGHINVDSRGPGHGSTFTVTVPIHASATSASGST